MKKSRNKAKDAKLGRRGEVYFYQEQLSGGWPYYRYVVQVVFDEEIAIQQSIMRTGNPNLTKQMLRETGREVGKLLTEKEAPSYAFYTQKNFGIPVSFVSREESNLPILDRTLREAIHETYHPKRSRIGQTGKS